MAEFNEKILELEKELAQAIRTDIDVATETVDATDLEKDAARLKQLITILQSHLAKEERKVVKHEAKEIDELQAALSCLQKLEQILQSRDERAFTKLTKHILKHLQNAQKEEKKVA